MKADRLERTNKRKNFVISGIPLMDVTKNDNTEEFMYALIE